MPKSTFFNLPSDKRDRIIALAIEEFSERPYHRASLSRLVSRAGIAKGSVYQYFDGKLDLYRWLLTEEVPRRKSEHLQQLAAAAPPENFREFLQQAVMSGVRFMLANPRLSQLASAVAIPTDDPLLQALYGEVLRDGHERFTTMLREMVDAGQLRADVDVHLIARLISAVLGTGLRDIVLGQLGVDMMTLFRNPERAAQLSDDKLETLVGQLIAIIVDGVGTTSGTS